MLTLSCVGQELENNDSIALAAHEMDYFLLQDNKANSYDALKENAYIEDSLNQAILTNKKNELDSCNTYTTEVEDAYLIQKKILEVTLDNNAKLEKQVVNRNKVILGQAVVIILFIILL